MQLTCSTRSFPSDNLDLSLARIQWAGFKAAEIAIPFREGAAPDPVSLREALDKVELELSGIDAGSLAFDSTEQALEAAAHIGRCALASHDLDGARVLFRATSGTIEAVAYGLAQLVAAMPGYRVRVCPVNAVGSLLAAPEDLEELRERLERQAASERLALALDPAAANRAGWDPDEFARAAELPLGYVYLTDSQDDVAALPGDGELEWSPLIAALRADGYDGYLSLSLVTADPLTAESDAKEVRGFAEALIYGVL